VKGPGRKRYDRLRFIKPVFIGDTLRVRVILKEKRGSAKRPDHDFLVGLLEAPEKRLIFPKNG
jgi:acyl dehydratase